MIKKISNKTLALVKKITKKILRKAHLIPLSEHKRLKTSIDEQLESAENTINFYFKNKFESYINEEVLPRAEKAKNAHKQIQTITKNSRTRFKINGMTRKQNFFLELDAISRINIAMRELGIDKHFPLLVDYSCNYKSITLSHVGISLKDLQEPIFVTNVDIQIDSICKVLEAAKVKHIDMQPNGKNLVINEAGIISLIDFDMAICGDLPFNNVVVQRLKKGAGLTSADSIIETLKKNEFVQIS